MMLPDILFYATLAIVLLVVLALVVYLLAIIVALRRAGTHLAQLAGGLQQIVDDTEPLEGHLGTINGALGQLADGVGSVDNHLVGIAKVFKLV